MKTRTNCYSDSVLFLWYFHLSVYCIKKSLYSALFHTRTRKTHAYLIFCRCLTHSESHLHFVWKYKMHYLYYHFNLKIQPFATLFKIQKNKSFDGKWQCMHVSQLWVLIVSRNWEFATKWLLKSNGHILQRWVPNKQIINFEC